MHRDGRRRIDDRIVNIAQPYVRPIKRGKAGKKTEFGAKLNVSEIEGKFGQAKSKYGLDDIQTRREDASYACIGCILLALNVMKLSEAAFLLFFAACRSCWEQWYGGLAEIDTVIARVASEVRAKTNTGSAAGLRTALTF